jgi:hypothetical protein
MYSSIVEACAYNNRVKEVAEYYWETVKARVPITIPACVAALNCFTANDDIEVRERERERQKQRQRRRQRVQMEHSRTLHFQRTHI